MTWHQVAQYLVGAGLTWRAFITLYHALNGRPSVERSSYPATSVVLVLALSALSAFIYYSAGLFS